MKILKSALRAIYAGETAAICTVIGVEGSAPRSDAAKMLVYSDGRIQGTVGGGVFEQRVIDEALLAIEQGKHRRFAAHLTRDLGMCCGGEMEVFVEVLDTQFRVHLFGAGHVGQAVSKALAPLDFSVSVYDERDDWLQGCKRDAITLVSGDPLKNIPEIGPLDFLLIFTHSHPLDQAILEKLIHQDFGYLGMIGSKTKVAQFFLRLKASGVPRALFTKVSAPIGLDIGAETPEEIAISIVAELVRVRRGHVGPVRAMSEVEIPARGGDGRGIAPALSRKSIQSDV
jgi:xanthine dehydrogenase accessory factor